MAFSYAADISIVTVVMPSHCSGPMRSKQGAQGLSGLPLGRPDDLARVVVEHDRQVPMTLPIGACIHTDAREPLPPIGVETRLAHPTNDPADGAPGHAQNTRHRRDVRLPGQEGRQLLHAMGAVRSRSGPRHQRIAGPAIAPDTRDPPAAIHQPDPDRSPVEILPPPHRRGVVIRGCAPATCRTPWFSPRRRDLDRDFIVTIHGDPTDVQVRDTDEFFEYRCEAHEDLRLTVEFATQLYNTFLCAFSA